jgi:aminopeptidase N
MPVGIGDPLFAAAGSPGLDVVHYESRLTFDIDESPTDTTISATTTVSAVATEPIDAIHLDLSGHDVEAVTVDGGDAIFCTNDRELEILLPAPLESDDLVEIQVVSRTGITGTTSGLRDLQAWTVSETGVALLAEPLGAAAWVPSNNHPSDAATFDVTFSVPDGYSAVGPGVLVSEQRTGNGSEFRWVMDTPIATYLAPVAVDRFLRTEIDEEIPVTLWSNVAGPPQAALDALGATDEIIDVLEGWFGPYPFDRSGAIVFATVPPIGVALETTPTISYFGETTLPRIGPRLVVHELAHMWAGNHVRLENWDDLWLKEGLATFAEFLWEEARAGEERYDSEITRGVQRIAQTTAPPMGSPTADALYTARSYTQGGLTFAALRSEYGDEAVRTLLTTWFSRFGGRAAGTDEFLDLVSELLGAEAAALVDDFLTAEGVPAYYASG